MTQKIFREFVYGGHLLSFGASSIVLTTLILAKLPITWQLFFIPYLMSQIIYTYNHHKELSEDRLSNPERTQHITQKRNSLPVLMMVYCLALIFTLFFVNWAALFYVLMVVTSGIVYTLYLKRAGQKNIIGLKNYYVSFVWASLPFLVMLHYNSRDYELFIAFFLFIFLRFTLSTIYFDIKDIDSDSALGVKTYPVRYGKNQTLRFLHLLDVAAICSLILSLGAAWLPFSTIAFILLSLYSTFYVIRARTVSEKGLRVLSYIMVDGEYVLWFPLILISSLMLK